MLLLQAEEVIAAAADRAGYPVRAPAQVSSAVPGRCCGSGRGRDWAACPQEDLEMALVPSIPAVIRDTQLQTT